MTIDVTVFNPALKTYYAKKLQDVTYKNNPLFALMPKDEGMGIDYKMPIKTATAQGWSADESTAFAIGQDAAESFSAFTVTQVVKEGMARIPRLAIQNSRNDNVAFLKLTTSLIDGQLANATKRLSVELFREGFGVVGVINSSITGATTVTLSRIADANNFEKGQYINVAASATATKRTRQSGISTTGLKVTGVNRVTGVLTLNNAIDDGTNGFASVANGDSIFYAGDHQSTTGARTNVAGLGAWIPTTAPAGAESFFGVNRSTDSRLYGVYVDATATPLYEALIDGDQAVMTQGGELSHYFMHPSQWALLAKQLEGKVQISNEQASARVSFKAIELAGMNGNTVKLVADRNCPADRVYGLELSAWKLLSAGPAINPFTEGDVLFKAYNSQALEYRYSFYGNVACDAPGHNVVLSVSAQS